MKAAGEHSTFNIQHSTPNLEFEADAAGPWELGVEC
jgi:hypothetical protein